VGKHKFKTEVSQLLDLIIHSLYSHREIFLRELVSNASDALDKLRYLTLTDAAYKGLPFVPRVDISFSDGDEPTLTLADSGLGMSEKELTENLGTIARSGTRRFLDELTKSKGGSSPDTNLIGQFGVGFYSAFMVADRVEVLTKRAGESSASRWTSDGRGQYEIAEAERDGVGTTVTLALNEDGREYASRWKIESIVKKYSNHIGYPIHLHYTEASSGDKKKDAAEPQEQIEQIEQINAASALWARPKSELTEDDYVEFYNGLGHSVGDDEDKPLHYVHTRAEGTMEYTTLFYIPAKAPPDLYYADYKPGVKLYVNRVFITDDEKELLPTYLRFVRGVIDSQDLPLNVSREILQQNRTLAAIRNASVKKLLSELESLTNNHELYDRFITEYGRPLKEGLYQDFANRDQLLELVRFRSTEREGMTSLASYVERMQSDQKAIYYITGERSANLAVSPLLEVYRERGIEVLIMDDEIDAFVIPSVAKYKEHELKSVNRTDTADDLGSVERKEQAKEIGPLLRRMQGVLGDSVKEVKASARLTDSPSCLVADESDPTASMQGVLKALGQEAGEFKPVLEVNPGHDIVQQLKASDDEELIADASHLLFDQAMLIEGVPLPDPVAFAQRLNRFMARALG
jgi:molecular chaperone HtpG